MNIKQLLVGVHVCELCGAPARQHVRDGREIQQVTIDKLGGRRKSVVVGVTTGGAYVRADPSLTDLRLARRGVLPCACEWVSFSHLMPG